MVTLAISRIRKRLCRQQRRFVFYGKAHVDAQPAQVKLATLAPQICLAAKACELDPVIALKLGECSSVERAACPRS